MIKQEIHNTLYQFKRTYKRQIAYKYPILPKSIEDKIKRKHLQNMNALELKSFIKALIKVMEAFQKKREKPHQGLDNFQKTLKSYLH